MEQSKKQWWALLVIPIEFIIGQYIFPLLPFDDKPLVSLILSVLLFGTGFAVMIYIFKDFLKAQWRLYRHKLFWKLLISIFLVAGAFLILHLVREIIPAHLLTIRSSASDSSAQLSAGWALLAAVVPFIAPFAEELTFRYLLLGKFTSRAVRAVMLIVQGILFGLIHINNFNGNVFATIPYMVIGIYFGVIYLAFNNIWGSIMVHWMFNSMNSIFPALLLFILSFFGV
ncbi:CPBP family intramembrane glutamic endopeptidase [Enterococcus pallens]|uniref:CAAX prenyl protease 2/Lysostaphin resistance protein A-like domain-containing protein n=1 Tax=Enterococcus pallens ATCC BAA-351 TaxID=1158607 RepID=R2T7F4_9ENTE|nr:type II CAAX endopeptidase family protein [Enterococcus pallens]EOH96194.1 hypothetical protein UAU_00843 [Enterococcus pallens ATCC BAA-351]EOU14593.1 hypothetical protein I588_04951 [Enterococcus pallens ATCC BAA-351]OJG80914.1 hypothetical protein RV10_GL003913 [Enterococcus pallens]